jgi:orotate phosphoribosyltransferase
MAYDRRRLIELVLQKAVVRGEFRLASGRTSSYYIDCRRLTLDGEGANVVAAGMIDAISNDWPDAIGGMAIGADPITAAVITLAWQQGRRLAGFIVRKESKEHGTQRLVEGPVIPGQRAVIVEDTVTTGSSSLAAVDRVQQFGLIVDRVVAIVDRQEGAAATFAQHGLRFQALVTAHELGL